MAPYYPKSSCCLVEAVPLVVEEKGKSRIILKCSNCGEFCEDSKRTSRRKVLERFVQDLFAIDQGRGDSIGKTKLIKKRIEEALDLL